MTWRAAAVALSHSTGTFGDIGKMVTEKENERGKRSLPRQGIISGNVKQQMRERGRERQFRQGITGTEKKSADNEKKEVGHWVPAIFQFSSVQCKPSQARSATLFEASVSSCYCRRPVVVVSITTIECWLNEALSPQNTKKRGRSSRSDRCHSGHHHHHNYFTVSAHNGFFQQQPQQQNWINWATHSLRFYFVFGSLSSVQSVSKKGQLLLMLLLLLTLAFLKFPIDSAIEFIWVIA